MNIFVRAELSLRDCCQQADLSCMCVEITDRSVCAAVHVATAAAVTRYDRTRLH